jgi:thioredoxin 2
MSAFRCAGCGGINRVPRARLADNPVCGRCKAALDVSGAPQEVTADELEAIIQDSPVPVLVDVWAPWCGPCRTAAPIVERIAKARAGMVLVLKVNADEQEAVARRYQVTSLPTFLYFRGGELDARQEGLLPEPIFARWVDGFALAA